MLPGKFFIYGLLDSAQARSSLGIELTKPHHSRGRARPRYLALRLARNMQEENNTHALQNPPEILLKFRDQKDTKTATCKWDQARQMPPYYPESNSGSQATQNLIQYMLKKIPSPSHFLYIYMHGNRKIASVKSAKLTIHLQRTCKRRIIPTVSEAFLKFRW